MESTKARVKSLISLKESENLEYEDTLSEKHNAFGKEKIVSI